jgi:Sigma-70 factor, region 1.1
MGLRYGTLKMDPHEAALTDLISLARLRGSITMEDLRKALPVDSMTVEDLSHALTRLDQAGFDLEIDPTLLLSEDKVVPKDATPVAKREKIELPEPMPEGRRQQMSFPASADEPILKNRTIRPSSSDASAPTLPWILAFAIVVFAVFAAFAF